MTTEGISGIGKRVGNLESHRAVHEERFKNIIEEQKEQKRDISILTTNVNNLLTKVAVMVSGISFATTIAMAILFKYVLK